MKLEELKRKKTELIKSLKDIELKYILDETIYTDIITKSTKLKQNYFSSYNDAHLNHIKKIRDLKEILEKDNVWQIINKICINNKILEKYFNTKYSINKIIKQFTNNCTQEHDDILKNDILSTGICQICKKTIVDLTSIFSVDIELLQNEININIFENLNKSTSKDLFDKNVLLKFNDLVKNVPSDKYKAFLIFLSVLEKDGFLKNFLESLEQFFGGKIIKIVDVNLIINNLKAKNEKIQGEKKFLELLGNEIQNFFNNQSENKDKIEWIFQL